MINTRAHTLCLEETIRGLLDGQDFPTLVTMHPEEATPALLDGRPVVIITPPRISFDDAVTYSLEWEIPVVGAPIGDESVAWERLDGILSLISAHIPSVTSARPITWTGAQTAQAPAFLLTLNATYYTTNQ